MTKCISKIFTLSFLNIIQYWEIKSIFIFGQVSWLVLSRIKVNLNYVYINMKNWHSLRDNFWAKLYVRNSVCLVDLA